MHLPHPLLAPMLLLIATGQAWSQLPALERADIQQKMTVVVMPFEFAAPLPAQPRAAGPRRPSVWPPLLAQPVGMGRAPFLAPRLAHAPVLTSAYPAYPVEAENGGVGEAIGIGVADLLIARLLEMPGIHVVERHRLDLLMSERRLAGGDTTVGDTAAHVLRARYIITGSVTRFGTEERRALGGLGGRFGLGALGFKRPKTQVTLTARVIDATSGEIIASITGAGASTKGGSILIGGIGGGIGGGVAIGSSEFRASALGEATERAVDALARDLVAKQARLGGG